MNHNEIVPKSLELDKLNKAVQPEVLVPLPLGLMIRGEKGTITYYPLTFLKNNDELYLWVTGTVPSDDLRNPRPGAIGSRVSLQPLAKKLQVPPTVVEPSHRATVVDIAGPANSRLCLLPLSKRLLKQVKAAVAAVQEIRQPALSELAEKPSRQSNPRLAQFAQRHRRPLAIAGAAAVAAAAVAPAVVPESPFLEKINRQQAVNRLSLKHPWLNGVSKILVDTGGNLLGVQTENGKWLNFEAKAQGPQGENLTPEITGTGILPNSPDGTPSGMAYTTMRIGYGGRNYSGPDRYSYFYLASQAATPPPRLDTRPGYVGNFAYGGQYFAQQRNAQGQWIGRFAPQPSPPGFDSGPRRDFQMIWGNNPEQVPNPSRSPWNLETAVADFLKPPEKFAEVYLGFARPVSPAEMAVKLDALVRSYGLKTPFDSGILYTNLDAAFNAFGGYENAQGILGQYSEIGGPNVVVNQATGEITIYPPALPPEVSAALKVLERPESSWNPATQRLGRTANGEIVVLEQSDGTWVQRGVIADGKIVPIPTVGRPVGENPEIDALIQRVKSGDPNQWLGSGEIATFEAQLRQMMGETYAEGPVMRFQDQTINRIFQENGQWFIQLADNRVVSAEEAGLKVDQTPLTVDGVAKISLENQAGVVGFVEGESLQSLLRSGGESMVVWIGEIQGNMDPNLRQNEGNLLDGSLELGATQFQRVARKAEPQIISFVNSLPEVENSFPIRDAQVSIYLFPKEYSPEEKWLWETPAVSARFLGKQWEGKYPPGIYVKDVSGMKDSDVELSLWVDLSHEYIHYLQELNGQPFAEEGIIDSVSFQAHREYIKRTIPRFQPDQSTSQN